MNGVSPFGPTDVAGLDQTCRDVVYPHVFENANREVGGVLIGRVSTTGSLPYVTGAIEALHADENRADLTFTQDTWGHVHHVLEDRAEPDERIVGWYHSHPNFGIFLSEHDLFVHRHVFADPSQVALVIDPIKRIEGLFGWQKGGIEMLFERSTPRGWRSPELTDEQRAIGDGRRSAPILVHVAALLVGLLAGIALYTGVLATSPPPATGVSAPHQVSRESGDRRGSAIPRPSRRGTADSSRADRKARTSSRPPAVAGAGGRAPDRPLTAPHIAGDEFLP